MMKNKFIYGQIIKWISGLVSMTVLVLCIFIFLYVMIGLFSSCTKQNEYSSVSFYTDSLQCGPIDIEIVETGNKGSIWRNDNFEPCGRSGQFTCKLQVGTYTYKASDECGNKWSSSIDLVTDQCYFKQLSY